VDKLKKNLNAIGLALVVGGAIGATIWPQHRALFLVAGALGLGAIGAHIALNLETLRHGLRRKAFLYSTNAVLVAVLVLGILVLVNHFLSKHHYRADLTQAKRHSLSDQSVTVMKNLKTEISAKGFFREGNYGRAAMEDLLKIYSYHSSRFRYEFIDPDKNPGLVKRYDVTQDGTTIFEAGDKESRITATGEEDITNAIIKVTREKKKAIYFLEGHGEQSVEESGDNGYSTAKTELEKLGYEVKTQSLALSEGFPEDCALLVIPGPVKDLLPNEIETIKGLIGRGGRVLFMIDPETAPGMTPFLAEYGVVLENDIVVDTVSRLLGGDYFMPVVSQYDPHQITDKFRYATFFPFARSVAAGETVPEGVTLSPLAKTSSNSWSERQLDVQEVGFDEGKDKEGPINLVLVGTVKGKEEPAKPEDAESQAEPEKPEQPGEEAAAPAEGRIAVLGDSDFVKNRYYNLSGNGNFFLNIVNWLTEESDLISIQPKTQTPRTIHLTPSQGRLIFFVSVVILPLAVLAIGLSVWLRRRAL
jgi:ABC-type uncharacterized transport system involved in gliding motility auxiliary subunit